MADHQVFDPLEGSLKNVLEQTSLKWIFVGGKGGVGKTTTSCSLATQLSKVRERVLLISTDPAHNLSDAFSQKFNRNPTLINGFDNLYAMEIDPTPEWNKIPMLEEQGSTLKPMLQDMISAVPGLDEIVSFAALMKLVEEMNYTTVVFDTAPTGHTLRLLSAPQNLQKVFENFGGFQNLFPMFSQVSEMMGMGLGGAGGGGEQNFFAEKKAMIQKIHTMLTDPDATTFVCVCIAEFLPVYETERLVQELTKLKIDCHNIVVNQLLFPERSDNCAYCSNRIKMQKKYLDEINELYEDFHVTKVPMQLKEVRGKDDISAFSELLVDPATSLP